MRILRHTPGLILLMLVNLCGIARADDVVLVSQVDMYLSEADLPPAASVNWQPESLPRVSRTGFGSGDQRLWFRFRVEQPEQLNGQLYSLYFWRYNMSLTVFLNGQELGGDAFKPGFHTMAWNHPRLVRVPASAWQPGTNTFHIRFNPSPFGGTFADFKLGPESVLQPVWQSMYNKSIRLNETLLVFGVIAMIFSLLLWLFRRSDRVYLWFMGVAGFWCVVITHMVIYYNPIPYNYWLPMVHMAIDSWAFCMFCFVSRLLNMQHPRLERVLLVVLVTAIAFHAFGPRAYFWMVAYGFHLLMTTGLIYLFGRIFVRAFCQQDGLSMAVVGAVLVQVILALRDTWLLFFGDAEDWDSAVHLSQFGIPVMLIIFIFSLLYRFTAALDQSETLNRELEDRVDATRQALQKSFADNRQLELSQAAATERQKIYRDLHDDVGSKLLSIAHQNPENPASTLATSALESLRESVYRANYQDEHLLDFLASVREETKLRAAGQGVNCEWFEDPDLANEVIDAGQCYHLSRILRELVTNSLSHSRGSNISVAIELSEDKPGYLQLEVKDDGEGHIVPEEARSSGMKNIHYRADQIGGLVSWGEAEEQGVRFTLLFQPDYVEAVEARS